MRYLKGNNPMPIYLVALEEQEKQVLLRCLLKLLIVQIVQMENHVTSVRFVKVSLKVLILM